MMPNLARDKKFMQLALASAKAGFKRDEVPIGAVVVFNETVIAQAYNQPISLCDPTAHAEILALRGAAKFLNNYRLVGTELYVTVEPCCMCIGALLQARIARLVFGVREAKTGFISNSLGPHKLKFKITEGILASESQQLLQAFFQKKRNQPNIKKSTNT